MSARLTPSAGVKPDKLMRDALVVALHREATNGHGKTKKLYMVADRLVKEAIKGNVTAIVAIMDRVDGKPAQSVDVSGQVGVITLSWDLSALDAPEAVEAVAVQQVEALPAPDDD